MTAYPPQKQLHKPGLRVICVRWGDKYGDEYVYKLQAMAARHLPGS